MPVRSRSAALVDGAAHGSFGGRTVRCTLPVIPRISCGRIRHRRVAYRFGESREGLGDCCVSVLRRMLIAEGGRTGMAGPCHQLSGRCSLGDRPRQTGTPQIVEVDLGAPKMPTGSLPCGLERMVAKPPSLWSGQERRGWLRAYEGPQMPLQARQYVGWDADRPTTGFRLGQTELKPAPDVVGGPVLRRLQAASKPAAGRPTTSIVGTCRGRSTQPSRVPSAGLRPPLTSARCRLETLPPYESSLSQDPNFPASPGATDRAVMGGTRRRRVSMGSGVTSPKSRPRRVKSRSRRH